MGGGPLRFLWVVEAMGSSGGVRVIVEHAEGLAARGHDVGIVTKDPGDGWIRTEVPVTVVRDFAPAALPEADVAIATWFPTVLPTVRSGRFRRVFHLCQGYEGLHSFLSARLGEIEEAYAQEIPKLVVSPHLVDLLSPRYPGPFHVLPPSIRSESFAPDPAASETPHSAPIAGVMGPFEWDRKGVRVALSAVRALGGRIHGTKLHRLSPLPLSENERRIVVPDRFDVSLPAAAMPGWYHALDVLLFAPYAEGEGLGLPPLEAMAAGVPVVLTDIPSLRFVPDEAVARVAVGDVDGIAAAAEQLLLDRHLREERRARGLAFAATLRPERTLDALEAFLRSPG